MAQGEGRPSQRLVAQLPGWPWAAGALAVPPSRAAWAVLSSPSQCVVYLKCGGGGPGRGVWLEVAATL